MFWTTTPPDFVTILQMTIAFVPLLLLHVMAVAVTIRWLRRGTEYK